MKNTHKKQGVERLYYKAGTFTACQSYMPEGTTYAQLVKAFGEPNKAEVDNFKTDVAWSGFIDGMLFTIYNYKTGKAYLKEQGKAIEDLVGDDWHIGGKELAVVELVIEFLKETL